VGPSIAEKVRKNQQDESLFRRLDASIDGEVRFDPLTRTIYSTDASIYEITPLCVVLPRNADDVVKTVTICRDSGIAVIPRGAGTGLTGGAVGHGVLIDFSHHMDNIGRLDIKAQTVDVEPGVVLDDLNAFVAPHGLHFAPDVATSTRATVGGMIANNSCGAHSIVHGRTVDHVAGLAVVIGDGQVMTFGHAPEAMPKLSPEARRQREHLQTQLARLRNENHEEIRRRFPKHPRSSGGFSLNRLGDPGKKIDPVQILCGSEGTLGIVVGATLKLKPLPKLTGLVLLHYAKLRDALVATQHVLKHKPAAVEVIDHLILDARRNNPNLARRTPFIQGDPQAVLIVEFTGDSEESLLAHIARMTSNPKSIANAYATPSLLDPDEQLETWNLRKHGLGLLMSKPGDRQPYAFVEDTAVDPERLADYIDRFDEILSREGIEEVGHYAHASAGCLHIRPVLNLKDAEDIAKMRRVADAVDDLVIEFGGVITGEHGDGILRSARLEKFYGPKIVSVFKEIKELFDPDGILNPGKIVNPLDMTEHLRYGSTFQSRDIKTYLDFSKFGGVSALAEMCSGVGACRQKNVGTMCPSFRATGDETHTTRARANALRVALSNRGLIDGLDDPHLAKVMDLCISCKACKSECPTGVDMARIKAEFLARRNLREGVPRRSRLIAAMPALARWGSLFPRTSNLVMQSTPFRAFMERRFGLDRRVPPPKVAKQTFHAWFARHREKQAEKRDSRGQVVYFVDTWTNHFVPQTGRAAVKVLEAVGFEVLCPPVQCSGRPMISHGLLAQAKQLAQANIRILSRIGSPQTPIVGTEPSCLLTLVDEYPQLVRTLQARQIASRACTIETFLRRILDEHPDALKFKKPSSPLLYHGHCQQKALVGPEDAVALMKRVFGESASQIEAGCCGMAGSFGHEVEHYDVARAIGEEVLFPAVRQRGQAFIAASGFSCLMQIRHHTDADPKHLVEYIAEALEVEEDNHAQV